MEHASLTHLSIGNQIMVNINNSDEHEEEEILPFALSEYPGNGTEDFRSQRRRTATKIQNTTTAEIALKRATHSHSHDYSVASDKFFSQVGALEYTTNFKHHAEDINRQVEMVQNMKFHTQSDSFPTTTVGLPSSSLDIDGRQVTNQIESIESAGLEQKALPSLNRLGAFVRMASNTLPPFKTLISERQQMKDEPSVRVVEMERAGYNKTVGHKILCSKENGDQLTRLSSGCIDHLRNSVPRHQDESKSTDDEREGCVIEHSGSSLAIVDHKDFMGCSGNEMSSYPSSTAGLVSPSHSTVDHQVKNENSRSKSKESLKASTSMWQQRDDDTVLLESLNDSVIGMQREQQQISDASSASRARTMFSSTMSSMSVASGPRNSDDFDRYCSPDIVQENKNITRETITSRRKCLRSFEVAVPMPQHHTVREVMDVLSNPDLLRIWYEPVNALTVTDRKGGPLPAASPPFYSDGLVNNIGTYRNPSFEEKEEYDEGDGDVIIRSAAEEKLMITDKQREQHDGEWIQASTTTLISPYAHTNILARSFESSRAAIGFPTCGDISMFIERNKAQVGLSIGPFKGGTILSHTITVLEVRGENDECSITLIDDVKILDKDEEYRKFCSCFEMIQWAPPSVDGYMDQTIKSLENLRSLVQSRGITASARNSNIISRPEESSTMTQPLLG